MLTYICLFFFLFLRLFLLLIVNGHHVESKWMERAPDCGLYSCLLASIMCCDSRLLGKRTGSQPRTCVTSRHPCYPRHLLGPTAVGETLLDAVWRPLGKLRLRRLLLNDI